MERHMKIPVTRGFDKLDVIGFLTLRDDVDIPLDSVFALGYSTIELSSDGKPTKIQVQEVGLISDSKYTEYLKSEKEKQANL